jgi:hypothetical protein
LTVRKAVLVSYSLALGFCVLGALIVFMRTRYAVAFYLVIFGWIIVAAYKMGMVHEKPRVVTNGPLESLNPDSVATEITSENSMEIRSRPPTGEAKSKDGKTMEFSPTPHMPAPPPLGRPTPPVT